MLREASVEAASMSPSKFSSCRRTTKVQLPSELSKNGWEGGLRERGGTGGGGREEKNIRPAAAAQWNRKSGSFLLFIKGKSRGEKGYRK